LVNHYSFFKTESDDGIDYLFFTDKGRIYTVSFDTSIYENLDAKFPTLLEFGYGIIFKFDQSLPKEKGKDYKDTNVHSTIVAIVQDFLENSENETFIIYECPDYKQSKLFCNWVDGDEHSNIYQYGFEVQIEGTNDHAYFGFITDKNNPLITDAVSELEMFFTSL